MYQRAGKIVTTGEDTAVLPCIGIKIYDANNIAPESVPKKQEKQKGNIQEGGEVWKPAGIIYPCRANNIKNHFTCFWNYTQEEVLYMIKLEIFLVSPLLGTSTKSSSQI